MRTVFSRPVFLVLAAAALSMLGMAAAGPGIEGNANGAAVLPPEMARWEGPQDIGIAESENPKIGPELMGLVKSSDSDSNGDSTMDSSSLAVSGADLVPIQVLAKPDDLETVKSALLFLGGEVGGIGTVGFGEGGCEPDLTIVQGFAPVAVLEELASRDAVAYLRVPLKALMVREDKDAQLPADFDLEAWHKEGYRGGGVKVGVVDSGFAENASTDLVGFSATKYRNFADGEPEDSPGGDSLRGWESVRIVGEIAPDAEIYAARAETYVDVQEAVSWLAEEIGADVIRVPVVCFPSEDAPAFPESSDVFWATPNGFAWNEYGFGPFDDGGNGLHLFGHERNVEPVYFAPDPPLSSGNVFLRWEVAADMNTDLDLFLLRWDGSNWQLAGKSQKAQPKALSRYPLEFVTEIASDTEAFYGCAVFGREVPEDLRFDLLTFKDDATEATGDVGMHGLTTSQVAGVAALIKNAYPEFSADDVRSLVGNAFENTRNSYVNFFGANVLSFQRNAAQSSCKTLEWGYSGTYATGNAWSSLTVWTPEVSMSVLSLKVYTPNVEPDVEKGAQIKITFERSIAEGEKVEYFADSWSIDNAGDNNHENNVSFSIEAEDTIQYYFKNMEFVIGTEPLTVTVCDTPLSTGTLIVTITPQEAVDEGAKWQVVGVDGEFWRDSGTSLDLPEGGYTIGFKEIHGWDTPPNNSVGIVKGTTTELTGTYTPQYGSLRVTISPQAAVDEGGKWRVDGGDWLDSSHEKTGLRVGDHVVSFRKVRKWVEPQDKTISVEKETLANFEGTYYPEPFMTGNSKLTQDYNGNVGIGASYPDEKLVLSEGGFLHNAGGLKHMGAISDDETTELDGACSIHISGKYAYVAAFFDDGVEILDISDPSNPTHVGAITDNETTELDGARSIQVSGKYAYIASVLDDGVEILDISDPSNPTHVGAITDDETTELDGACSIHVSGKYAYVAASEDNGVEILDISDPSSPTHVGAISADGPIKLFLPYSIYVCGKYAYVAAAGCDGVEILDISDPSNPTHVGAIADDETMELDGAGGIQVSGKYAYVASITDGGVEILDISDPSNPTHVGAISDNETTALNDACSIHVSGKYAYVAAAEDNGVEILDISDPSNPTHVSAITDDLTTKLMAAYGIHVSGKYAYVAAFFDDGVEILDISGLDAPAASIGAIAADNLDVSERLQIGNALSVGGGVNVGEGGIKSDGALSAEGDANIGGDLDVENAASFGGEFGASGRISINDALKLAPRESPPPDPQNGYVYYDRTDPDAVCVYLEGQWVRIAGTGACQ